MVSRTHKICLYFFLTGTTANDVHYQAYLLEGIVRWNEDREVAALEGGVPSHTYNSALCHEVNRLSNMQYGHDFLRYQDPGKYTGETTSIATRKDMISTTTRQNTIIAIYNYHIQL